MQGTRTVTKVNSLKGANDEWHELWLCAERAPVCRTSRSPLPSSTGRGKGTRGPRGGLQGTTSTLRNTTRHNTMKTRIQFNKMRGGFQCTFATCRTVHTSMRLSVCMTNVRCGGGRVLSHPPVWPHEHVRAEGGCLGTRPSVPRPSSPSRGEGLRVHQPAAPVRAGPP